MFKDKDSKRRAATDTLIGEGTIAEGKLLCEASLRIEGEYRGDIDCKGDIIIGECGVARSNIVARDVTLAGKLFGDIETKGRLIITSSGYLSGNVTAHTLIVQDGGIINGTCLMEEKPADLKKSNLAGSEQSQSNGKQDNKNDQNSDTKAKSRQAG